MTVKRPLCPLLAVIMRPRQNDRLFDPGFYEGGLIALQLTSSRGLLIE